MGAVADRVGALLRQDVEFPDIGDELAGDRIGQVSVGVDQLDHVRRDGERVAGGDGFERGEVLRRDDPGLGEFGGMAERAPSPSGNARRRGHLVHRSLSSPVSTGVHCTRSMRGAPVASITRRSKPSATPLASGIAARAARNASSTG